MRLLAILSLALLPLGGWAQQAATPVKPAVKPAVSAANPAPAGQAASQPAPDKQTLADIKQELAVLYVRLKELKRELVTTQSPGLQNAGGGFQERIDALESAVQKLTAQTEELGNRIDHVVSDGTTQIHDLTFRLCQLEKGCDPSKLDLNKVLGGVPVAAAAPATTPDAQQAPGAGAGANGTQGPAAAPGDELAVGEQDDFNAALAAYNAQDYKKAVTLFQTFNSTYPGGPLAAAAHLYRGLALDALGQTGDAARAYLDAFSVNPDGAEAPVALYQLGLSLNALGQTEQACVTLGEVGVRFPTDEMVKKANAARTRIGCS